MFLAMKACERDSWGWFHRVPTLFWHTSSCHSGFWKNLSCVAGQTQIWNYVPKFFIFWHVKWQSKNFFFFKWLTQKLYFIIFFSLHLHTWYLLESVLTCLLLCSIQYRIFYMHKISNDIAARKNLIIYMITWIYLICSEHSMHSEKFLQSPWEKSQWGLTHFLSLLLYQETTVCFSVHQAPSE